MLQTSTCSLTSESVEQALLAKLFHGNKFFDEQEEAKVNGSSAPWSVEGGRKFSALERSRF